MASTNDITGDKLITKSATDSYRDGWDRIFGKQKHDSDTCPKCKLFWVLHDFGVPSPVCPEIEVEMK